MPTIYQGVLHDCFEMLAPVLQTFLGNVHGGRASGRLRVTRAAGWLRNGAAWALGIPPAGEYDLLLEVVPHGDGQRWARHFGKHTLTTMQYVWRDLLIERKGLASLGFVLIVEGESLLFKARRAWVLGVPVPLWLSPCIEAENRHCAAGGWHVRVVFRVPLLGQVAEYSGTVIANAGDV